MLCPRNTSPIGGNCRARRWRWPAAGRWPLAGWAIQHGKVWSDDWDEANAFCNLDCEAAGMWDHEAPEESLSPWLQNFYDGLDVWVASPYGLVGLYKLRHGGAEGDS